MTLLVERVEKTMGALRRKLSGVETVKNDAGVVRFERGRTYFRGEVDGVPIEADVNARSGEFQITVSRPTGETFSDGAPVTERSVRVMGHRSWGRDIPAKLRDTTYF